MPYGYMGKVLHVDLSSGTLEVETPPESFYRTYMGGSALNLHYLLKMMPPGADPLGPENVLAISVGTLTGAPISGLKPYQISRMNLAYVSESLNLFTNMTVRENLLLGAYSVQEKARRDENLAFVFELFPRLQERAGQLAGTMSGGERKMLAIARSIMAGPRAMLIDEPSLGLAPHLAHEVFQALATLNKRGVTILLVEQNVHMTLEITSRAYVMEHGRVVMEGPSKGLAQDEHVRKAYLGL